MDFISDNILLAFDFHPLNTLSLRAFRGYNWKWKAMIWSQAAINELACLCNLNINAAFNHNQDAWEWTLCDKKSFSVKSVRNLLISNRKKSNMLIFPWNKLLPKKINVFGWRLLLNKLPSKDSLMRRGLNVGNTDCVFCGEQDESMDHLMTGCVLSRELWNKIEDWCGLTPMIIFSAKDLLFYHETYRGSNRKKVIVQSIKPRV